MENLYVGRFNYSLVVFSLFITAGFANTFSNYKYLVFYFGAIFLATCWIPLFRGFKKHDKIMKIIFNYKKKHPASVIQEIMKAEGFKSWFVISKWMGIYIPCLCIIFLLLIGIFINLGYIK
jgi:hypothetical protein